MRTIADVVLPDDTNVNQELVSRVGAEYAPADTMLDGLEHEVREGVKGLWTNLQSVLPWEERKRK